MASAAAPAAPHSSTAAAAAIMHHSTSFLSSPTPTQLQLALLILNVEKQTLGSGGLFSHLWRASQLRVCADGAANRLHDAFLADDEARGAHLPDLIAGDLDSLRDDVAQFYAARGVPIARQPEQDRHDFEKCLTWLRQRQGDAAPRLSVVAMGAFGGRLDQQMANINMLYRYAGAFERLVLLGDESLAFLLPAGKHVIEPNPEVEEGTCGLIPLGGRCTRVRTSGLRWNLSDAPLEFGSLVSSSNKFVDARVTVETSSPLLWTTSLHRAAVKHARL